MFQSAIAFLETQGVPTPFATAIIRLLLGSICGGLIGLEREMKGRPAGLKTFSLVCMGATLVMVTNEFIYVNVANSTGDSARMAAQVISGIGFLGAGTIMTTGNDRVKGLTTAAALGHGGHRNRDWNRLLLRRHRGTDCAISFFIYIPLH